MGELEDMKTHRPSDVAGPDLQRPRVTTMPDNPRDLQIREDKNKPCGDHIRFFDLRPLPPLNVAGDGGRLLKPRPGSARAVRCA